MIETNKYIFNVVKNLKTVAFLNKDDASLVLSDNEHYFSEFSRFDKNARSLPSDEGKIKNYYAQQSLNWDDWVINKIIDIFDIISHKMENYTIPFPEEIKLILTTGKDEGHAAYCLKDAIILSQEKANYPSRDLESLLTHELFHIYSRHNPKKRRELYNMLGFIECPKLEFPDELKDFSINNPDTFEYPCYIELNGSKYMPFLYSPKEFGSPLDDDDDERDDWRGPRKEDLTFFDYITFGLIEVEFKRNSAVPMRRNGKTNICDDSLPGYLEKVGRNTDYVIHPEEALASNFVFMINNNDEHVRNPEILVKMRELISENS